MQKLIPISSIEDLTKVVNYNADYVAKFLKHQRKINKYMLMTSFGLIILAYLKDAQVKSQNDKIKELENRLAELEPNEGEKGQE